MKQRAGKTATFSISVDDETRQILKEEARRNFHGNISALVTAIAKEAKREASLDWLLQNFNASPMTKTARDAFLAEIDGKMISKKRRRRAA